MNIHNILEMWSRKSTQLLAVQTDVDRDDPRAKEKLMSLEKDAMNV
jgi:hypothetical protein